MNIALDASTLSLVRDGLIAVRDAQGSRVRCLSGSLWITEDRSAGDTIVSAGECFRIKRPGLTLIMALQPATLQLVEAPDTERDGLGDWFDRVFSRRAVAASAEC